LALKSFGLSVEVKNVFDVVIFNRQMANCWLKLKQKEIKKNLF